MNLYDPDRVFTGLKRHMRCLKMYCVISLNFLLELGRGSHLQRAGGERELELDLHRVAETKVSSHGPKSREIATLSLPLSLSAGGCGWQQIVGSLVRIDFHCSSPSPPKPMAAEGSGHSPACPSKITTNEMRASHLELHKNGDISSN